MAASAVVLWRIEEACGFAEPVSNSDEIAHYLLPIIRIRETDADGLVNEEHVGIVVPGVLETFRSVRACHSAGT